MKSIFDRETRADVVRRIGSLQPDSKPLWGKMTVGQMVRHCSLCEEYYFGKMPVRRSLLGRVIGKFAIGQLLKNDSTQLGKNAPTNATFKVTEKAENGVTQNAVDLEKAKAGWRTLIEDYGSYSRDHFDHWFFGRMSREQLGQFIYKHCDHHLRQFGC